MTAISFRTLRLSLLFLAINVTPLLSDAAPALTSAAATPVGIVSPGAGTSSNGASCTSGTGNPANSCASAGNPINLITGNKYQRDVDLPALPGVLGLEIVRHYNSIFAMPGVPNGVLGRGWRLSYEVNLYVVGNTIQIIEPDGHRVIFNRDPLNPSHCSTPDPANGSIATRHTDRGEAYLWTRGDGAIWDFNEQQKLVQIRALTGETVSLQYSPDGLLMQVTDPQGRRLQLSYLDRAAARSRTQFSGVQSINSPVGRFEYAYGSALPKGATLQPVMTVANLVKVTSPNTHARLYHYEDPQHPTLMTGISMMDAANSNNIGSAGKPVTQRLSTFAYQADGRAILSTHANDVDRVTLSYPERGVALLTNSLGQTTVYRHADIAGEYRLLEARGPGCRLCDAVNVRYGYDKLGRTIDVTRLADDGTPIQTVRTTRDYVGRPLSVGTIPYRNGKPSPLTPQRRYEYGRGTIGLPTLIARPSVITGKEAQTRITYNAANQPLTVTDTGWAPATNAGATSTTPAIPIERTTTYRYAQIGRRSVLAEIDGPLVNGPSHSPVDSDITRYQWDPRGDRIQSITYPMNRVASFDYDKSDVNASARLIKSTSPDGVVTELAYNAQGALVQMRRAGAATVYRHDAAGRTNEVLDPTGQHLWFGYSASGKMGWIADQQNDRIALEHDSEGQLMRARLLNPDGTVSQQGANYQSGSVDAAAPHSMNAAPASDTSDLVLADVRRLIEAAQSPDSINVARPNVSTTAYAAVQDALASVDDALVRNVSSATQTAVDSQGAVTTYLTDDFGRLVLSHSPTTGTTTYRYNTAGHILARINQDGSRAQYTRDAAGRVIAVQAVNAQNKLDENASIVWGAANKPVRVRYLAGEELFDYDHATRLICHTQRIDGKRFTLRYQYNRNGQLITKTLPDGQTLRYRYRGSVHARAGLLESVWLNGWNSRIGNQLTGGLFDRPVIEGMNQETERYTKRGFSFGNGLTNERAVDAQGRVVSAGNPQVGQTRLDYAAKEFGSSVDEASVPKVSTQHSVSLSHQADAQTAQALASRISGLTTRWVGRPTLEPESLFTSDRSAPYDAITFDTVGRQTAAGSMHYLYDSLNRLVEVRQRSGDTGIKQQASDRVIARYRYNLFGQRVAKVVWPAALAKQGMATYFFYDGANLAAEANDNGAIGSQYIWLNDKPVALLRDGHLLSIHTDHRNAPLAITDAARRVVWQANVTDFGRATPVQGAALGRITFNLRLSNQYFDAETGLHYNTHRYVDPVAQRYLTPDPMGLAAGPDLYAFALNQPHAFSDPLGLQPIVNEDLSNWSFANKLFKTAQLIAPKLPTELSAALLDLVSPEHIATTTVVFGIWAASHTFLAGEVVDVLVLGVTSVLLGQAGSDLILGLIRTTLAINRAKCTADLNAAADTLVKAFSKAAGGFIEGTLLRKVVKTTERDLGTPAITRIEEEINYAKNPKIKVQGSPIDYKHTIGADYNKRGQATGGHSLVNGDVRIVPGTESAPNAVGVYRATIQVPDPKNPGQWTTKTANNGINDMFPKDWGPERIKYEVDAAWNSPQKLFIGDKWSSKTPSGVAVEGFVRESRVTVYPKYE